MCGSIVGYEAGGLLVNVDGNPNVQRVQAANCRKTLRRPTLADVDDGE